MFIYSYIICLFRECVRKKKKHFNTILIGAAFTIIQILYLLCYIFLCAERICLIQTKERNEKAIDGCSYVFNVFCLLWAYEASGRLV